MDAPIAPPVYASALKAWYGAWYMVSDGSSEIGVHVGILLFWGIWLLHREQSQVDFFLRKDLFFFMHAQHIPSYHLLIEYHASKAVSESLVGPYRHHPPVPVKD